MGWGGGEGGWQATYKMAKWTSSKRENNIRKTESLVSSHNLFI